MIVLDAAAAFLKMHPVAVRITEMIHAQRLTDRYSCVKTLANEKVQFEISD